MLSAEIFHTFSQKFTMIIMMKSFKMLFLNYQMFQNQVKFFLNCKFFSVSISHFANSSSRVRYHLIETSCTFNLYHCPDIFTEKTLKFTCLIIMRNKSL